MLPGMDCPMPITLVFPDYADVPEERLSKWQEVQRKRIDKLHEMLGSIYETAENLFIDSTYGIRYNSWKENFLLEAIGLLQTDINNFSQEIKNGKSKQGIIQKAKGHN